ncbi:MAG: sugar phosphate isomerase/epimerase family protein [Hyphomicrobiales bacterium]
MRALAGRPELCAINTATLGFQTPIEETIDAVAREGFGAIAPWRRELEGKSAGAVGQRIKDAGLEVTGYCRSSFIPALARSDFDRNVEDNRRALREAAALGAQSFVMVVGSLPPSSKDLARARAQVAEATSLLLEDARELGVRLALEPLHPIYAADRSCLTLLSEALDLCDKLEPSAETTRWLGVCIDVYHVWWDPNLETKIARAGRDGRILGFHVCDWLVPTRDVLTDRGMMGDGIIDVPRIRGWIEDAGFDGFVEVEIFSAENWWRRPIAETLRVCKERFGSAC